MCDQGFFMGSQKSPHSTGFFGTQILGLVFLATVVFAQMFLLCLVDDSQHTSDWFADNPAEKKIEDR